MPILLRYFRDRDGSILLPPDEETAEIIRRTHPLNYCEATTLAEVDAIQAELERDERIRLEREGQREDEQWRERRDSIRSSLTSRMSSAATSEYEREFIRLYLQLSDQRKRDLYKSRFTCDQAYFAAREFDNPDSAIDRSLTLGEGRKS